MKKRDVVLGFLEEDAVFDWGRRKNYVGKPVRYRIHSSKLVPVRLKKESVSLERLDKIIIEIDREKRKELEKLRNEKGVFKPNEYSQGIVRGVSIAIDLLSAAGKEARK